MQSLLSKDEFSFRLQCGYSKPVAHVTLDDRQEVVRNVWLHFVLFHIHAELEQLRNGLRDTLQFELLIISYPSEVWGLFASSDAFNVTSNYLCDSFVIHYSPSGSNNCTKEETIVFYWNQYVFDCPQRQDEIGLLKFISGSSKIPATGFENAPSVRFTDIDCLPFVSTCDISITFPRSLAVLAVEEFQNKMDLGRWKSVNSSLVLYSC